MERIHIKRRSGHNRGSKEKKHILFCWDDDKLQHSLNHLLSHSFRVAWAMDLADARRQLTGGDFDAIVIHANIGRGRRAQCDGLKFVVEEIRMGLHGQTYIPVLLYSLLPEERIRSKAKEMYGNDMLLPLSLNFYCLASEPEAIRGAINEVLTDKNPQSEEIVKTLRKIRQQKAHTAWRRFEHEYATKKLVMEWDGVKTAFMEFEGEVARWEMAEMKFYQNERKKIRKVLNAKMNNWGGIDTMFVEKTDSFRADGTGGAGTKEPQRILDAKGWSATVIVVEDEEKVAGTIEKLLKNQGHNVTKLTQNLTRDHILRKIGTTKPDIVLLDLHLKKRNAVDDIAALREKYPEVKIIVVSGDRSQAAKAAGNGAHGFILKSRLNGDLPQEIVRALVNHRILVVDDEPDTVLNREFMEWCRDHRCEITLFTDPEGFASWLLSLGGNLAQFNLVLLDQVYHGTLRGPDLFRLIKEKRSDLPVYVLTSSQDWIAQQRVNFETGRWTQRDDYLYKPLDTSNVQKIQTLLGGIPAELRLEVRSGQTKQQFIIILSSQDGMPLKTVRVEPKQWCLLAIMAIKAMHHKDAVPTTTGILDGDSEKAILSKSVYHHVWSESEVRISTHNVNKKVHSALGQSSWELVVNQDKRYIFNPSIIKYELPKILTPPAPLR